MPTTCTCKKPECVEHGESLCKRCCTRCPKRASGRPRNGAIAQVSIAKVSQGATENVIESVTAEASVIHEVTATPVESSCLRTRDTNKQVSYVDCDEDKGFLESDSESNSDDESNTNCEVNHDHSGMASVHPRSRLQEVFRFLGLPYDSATPGYEKRMQDSECIPREWSRLRNAFQKAQEALLQVFFQRDSNRWKRMYSETMKKATDESEESKNSMNNLRDNLVKTYLLAKRNSITKRTAAALLVGTLGSVELSKTSANFTEETISVVKKRKLDDQTAQAAQKVQASERSKLISRRYAKKKQPHPIEQGTQNPQGLNKIPRSRQQGLGDRVRLNRAQIKSAVDDFEMLMRGEALLQEPRSIRRISEYAVQEALKFFLSEENICVLSWGQRKVHLSKEPEETIILPCLTRKKIKARIYEDYLLYCENHDPPLVGKDTLSRSTCLEILSLVTSTEKRSLSAVNYLLGELIYDNFIQVKRIIENYTPQLQKKELGKLMIFVSNFLKNQYPKHVTKEDGKKVCCSHGLKYGLLSSCDPKDGMDCDGCKFVPYFFDKLRTSVETHFQELGTPLTAATQATDADAALGEELPCVDLKHVLDAITRCENKTVLWRGQCLRVANQQKAIADLHDGMKRRALENKWDKPREVIIVCDYKMKYVSQYYRQKSTEHFGKRGISWHGYLIIFYTYDSVTGTVERQHVYCDQIVTGSNIQDGLALSALLEAFLCQLKKSPYFAHLEKVQLQSDNAAYYHNKFYIAALPIIGKIAGVEIARYIHTETCDGKCLIDAHFAMCMRFVDEYIGTGENAASPLDVFKALVHGNGVPNSFAQLVRINRGELEKMEQKYASMIASMKTVFNRKNEIVFTVEAAPCANSGPDPFKGARIKTQSWQFSGITNGTIIVIDADKQSAEIESTAESDDQEEDLVDEEEQEVEVEEQVEYIHGEVNNQAQIGRFFGTVEKCSILKELRHEATRARRAYNMPVIEETDKNADLVHENVEHQLAANVNMDAQEDQLQATEDVNSEDDEPQDTNTAGLRRDLIAFSIRHAFGVLQEHYSDCVVRNGEAEMEEYSLARTYDMAGRFLKPGWARRPKQGSGRGQGTGNHPVYLTLIAEIFSKEGKDKQHASWILDAVISKDHIARRLDHPTEQEVRNILIRLVKHKNKVKNNPEPPDYVGFLLAPSKGSSQAFFPCELEEFIRNNAGMKPKELLELALKNDQFKALLPEKETMDKFKTRVSNVKKYLKKYKQK